MKKGWKNIISFKCKHIHQSHTSQRELQGTHKMLSKQLLTHLIYSNFYIGGLHILYHPWQQQAEEGKRKGLASDDQRSCMNITFLMTQVRIPPKVDDFSIQSLQHTPIICCCVVFSCLDFFKTKSQSNVIGQFVVKIFQICINYILLCSVGAFTA